MTRYRNAAEHAYLDRSVQDAHHRSILTNLMATFELAAGDQVIEMGAGGGRYTEPLVAAGLSVVACEPDPLLHAKLQNRFGHRPQVRVLNVGTGNAPTDIDNVRALCGFHVLHHLDDNAVEQLAHDVKRVSASSRQFSCAFFVEPNPLNPLFMMQIALFRGMRFSEEKRIWRRGLGPLCERQGLRLDIVGHYGLVPPQLCRILPNRLLRWAPAIFSPRKNPIPLYRVIRLQPI